MIGGHLLPNLGQLKLRGAVVVFVGKGRCYEAQEVLSANARDATRRCHTDDWRRRSRGGSPA